jgi:hypothetical protein
MVIVDNLRTHTPAGSTRVRQMVAELHAHLRLIYTPAYVPDATRSNGAGAGRDGRSPITISGPPSLHCWRISMVTSKPCGCIRTLSCGRLAVRLQLKN